jgi:hypothetical protein
MRTELSWPIFPGKVTPRGHQLTKEKGDEDNFGENMFLAWTHRRIGGMFAPTRASTSDIGAHKERDSRTANTDAAADPY